MDQDKPQRRPIMRAVAFEEVGEAIGRLVDIARSDTGQPARVADFLLAWWNGPDNGHFPILHLCNCDAVIGEDMVAIMAYLAQEPTIYPDAWGYRDAMVELHRQRRDQTTDPTYSTTRCDPESVRGWQFHANGALIHRDAMCAAGAAGKSQPDGAGLSQGASPLAIQGRKAGRRSRVGRTWRSIGSQAP